MVLSAVMEIAFCWEDNKAPLFPNTLSGLNDGALLTSRKSSFIVGADV